MQAGLVTVPNENGFVISKTSISVTLSVCEFPANPSD